MIMPTEPATFKQATKVAVEHHVALHIAHTEVGANWSAMCEAAKNTNGLAVAGAPKAVSRPLR